MGRRALPIALIASGGGSGTVPLLRTAALSLLLDYSISLVDLLHLFLSHVLKIRSMIMIGMVFPCQIAIGFFHFLIAGIWCDIQYFIGVCDHVSESILSLSTVSCPIEKQRHFPADAFQRPSRTSRPVSGSP